MTLSETLLHCLFYRSELYGLLITHHHPSVYISAYFLRFWTKFPLVRERPKTEFRTGYDFGR